MGKETNSWCRPELVAERRGCVIAESPQDLEFRQRTDDENSSSSAMAILKTMAYGKADKRDMNKYSFVGRLYSGGDNRKRKGGMVVVSGKGRARGTRVARRRYISPPPGSIGKRASLCPSLCCLNPSKSELAEVQIQGLLNRGDSDLACQ